MKIPDEIRKTVAFVCYENKNTGAITPVGSCFFLGSDQEPGQNFFKKVYVVTARHVIDAFRDKGIEQTILRLNSRDANPPLITHVIPIQNWFVHSAGKTIDVAIHEMAVPANMDQLVFPIQLGATKDTFKEHEVELGEEVIVSGLFQHHFGAKKNIPIIRVGNLAALNEEKVTIKGFGEIDAYLIEARSIGGLSGSPAFLNLGSIQLVGGQIKHAPHNRPVILLLGLIHGHFNARPDELDNVDPDELYKAINAGIAIVVPVESILATIAQYEQGK